MGGTPLLVSPEISFGNFFEYTILNPAGQPVAGPDPLTNRKDGVSQLATPPLWGGVGWPIGSQRDELGQEYTFLWDTCPLPNRPLEGAQPGRGCSETYVADWYPPN